MTLVDTNIIIDVAGNDPDWAGWSLASLAAASLAGELIINETVFAEMSSRLPGLEDAEALADDLGLIYQPTPKPALFASGKAFALYRDRGGARRTVLPDFFIGAHAAVADIPILTRDPRHFRSYFPTVRLITPPAP